MNNKSIHNKRIFIFKRYLQDECKFKCMTVTKFSGYIYLIIIEIYPIGAFLCETLKIDVVFDKQSADRTMKIFLRFYFITVSFNFKAYVMNFQ